MELLIVVALMTIMTVIVVPNLLSRNIRKEFDSTVDDIVATLNQARDNAITWQKGTVWGVFFERYNVNKTCAFHQPRFGLYYTNAGFNIQGNGAFNDSSKVTQIYYIPKSVAFNETSTFSDYDATKCTNQNCFCFAVMPFKEITGSWWNQPAVPPATTTVTLYLPKSPQVSSTITISPNGFISYTTSSAQ